MDTIQRELIKAGRKDLAQKYYEKIAFADFSNAWGAVWDLLKWKPKATFKEIKKHLKKNRLYSGGDYLPKVLNYLKQRKLINEKPFGKDLVYMLASKGETMDTIQNILIKEGRKDLAQKYYEKVAKKSTFQITAAKNNIKTFSIHMNLLNKNIPDIRTDEGKKLIEGLVKKLVDSFAVELKTGMDKIDHKIKIGV